MTALIISPAFSFTIFNSSLGYILALIDPGGYDVLQQVVIFLCFGIWAFHVIIHNTHKFDRNVMTFLYFLSFAMAGSLSFSIFHILIIRGQPLDKAIKLDQMSQALLEKILDLMYFTIGAPFACALLVDRGGLHGFGLLCKTAGPFFFSFFLMIPWFSSYAFSRCWDLTWGNRPASTELDDAHGAHGLIQARNNLDDNDDDNENDEDAELIDSSSDDDDSDVDIHRATARKNQNKHNKLTKAEKKSKKAAKKQKEREKEKRRLKKEKKKKKKKQKKSKKKKMKKKKRKKFKRKYTSDSEEEMDEDDVGIPEITEADIVKAKFQNTSKWIVLFIIGANIGIYALGIYINSLIMSVVLAATAAFMLFSMIALTFEIINDIVHYLCNSFWDCLCAICCGWQDGHEKSQSPQDEFNHYMQARDEIDDEHERRLKE